MPTYPLDRDAGAADDSAMFVRCKKRFKDGKEHRYWSVVENVRVPNRRKGCVVVSCATLAAALPGWIQEWNPGRIFCAYDATDRGDRAANRAANRLIQSDNRTVRLRPPLDGKSWNEMLLRDRAGEPLQTDDRSLR